MKNNQHTKFVNLWTQAREMAAYELENPGCRLKNPTDEMVDLHAQQIWHCGTCIVDHVPSHLEPTKMAYIDKLEKGNA